MWWSGVNNWGVTYSYLLPLCSSCKKDCVRLFIRLWCCWNGHLCVSLNTVTLCFVVEVCGHGWNWKLLMSSSTVTQNTGRLGCSLRQAELDSVTCLFILVRDISSAYADLNQSDQTNDLLSWSHADLQIYLIHFVFKPPMKIEFHVGQRHGIKDLSGACSCMRLLWIIQTRLWILFSDLLRRNKTKS